MATKDRTCRQCGRQFKNEVGRGKTRTYCDKKCATMASKARNAAREASLDTCRVDGCGKPANRVGAGMCEMHYCRLRRIGSTEKPDVANGGPIEHSGGYLLVYAPDHPLRTGASPRVYEHRKVYYDAHGAGPFKCHVCASSLKWDSLHIDHLNDDVKDNRIENLAPACPACNTKRGQWKVARHAREVNGLEWNGQKKTAQEWAATIGISRSALMWRLKRGWSVDRALTVPRGKTGPKER